MTNLIHISNTAHELAPDDTARVIVHHAETGCPQSGRIEAVAKAA